MEPDSHTLAREFTRQLLESIGADTLTEVARRNLADPHKSACHSHDFTDANQVMIDAFTATFGREPDVQTEDGHLIEAAWAIARKRWHNLPLSHLRGALCTVE